MSSIRARSKVGQQEKEAWATPRYWVANIGYGGVSVGSLLSSKRAAVILWLPEDPAEAASHALSELAVAAQPRSGSQALEESLPLAMPVPSFL